MSLKQKSIKQSVNYNYIVGHFDGEKLSESERIPIVKVSDTIRVIIIIIIIISVYW